MLVDDVESVVQRVHQVPVPTEVQVVNHLVGRAEAARVVVDTEDGQVAPPAARPLLVGSLCTIYEVLQRLQLYVSHCAEVEVLALVVTSLIVHCRSNRVAGEVVVREPTCSTRSNEIVVHEVVAVAIIKRYARIGAQHVRQVVGILVADLHALALRVLEVQVLTNLQHIHVAHAVNHVLRVQTEGETTIVRLHRAAEDTVLILVADTGRELRPFVTARNVDGVVGNDGVLVAELLNPVRTLVRTVAVSSQQVGINIARPVVQTATGIRAHQVHDIHVLLCIQHLGHLVHVLPTHVTVVAHLYSSFLTLLGGDENHTVSSRRTVDGSRGSVLQHVDTLDVGRVQRVDVAAGHTVDDVDRSGAAVRTCTTDVDFESVTRLTRSCLDGDTRCLALQCAEGLGGVQLGDVLTFHFQCSTGDQLLLLDTVTYDHHFLQCLVVFLKSNSQRALVSNDDFLRRVTDVADDQRCAGLHIEREITVEIGNRTITCTLLHHRGSDHRAHGVDNSTCHFAVLLHCLNSIHSRLSHCLRGTEQSGDCHCAHHQGCFSKVLIHT